MRVRFPILLALALALAPAAPVRAARAKRAPAAADTARGASGADTGAALADSAAAPDTLPDRLRLTQTIGDAEDGHPALAEPSGVACDAFGRIFVTDATQHRVVRFDPGGHWLSEAGSLGSDPGNLRRPAGAVRVGSLGIAVLDRENRRVVLYDLFGRLVGVRTDLAALEDAIGRIDPIGLAADRGGALYVADAEGDRVLELDFSGALARTVGGYGSGGGSFRGLAGLGVGPRGELVTAERTGARVQRLDAGGAPLASWPIPVTPGRGGLPVAVDDSSRIAVADEARGALWLFDRDGRLLAIRAALTRPLALAFAPDGSLLVAEGAAGRVRRFRIEAQGPAAPGR